jgi:hypothetical protein
MPLCAPFDHSGKRYGRLVALRLIPKPKNSKVLWLFRCDCGREIISTPDPLLTGRTKSCGCLRRERFAALDKRTNVTHGATKTPTYRSWLAARARCFKPTHHKYHLYGGRGIVMCGRWRDDFSAFLADMGPRPYGHTLDRINVDGHYEPGNCRWATTQQQRANRRS